MSSRCRAAALKFLKIRLRSVYELREKLSGKGFEPREIEGELEYLKSIDLLNDRAFTASWIAYRLARPFGFKRIAIELRQKGIDENLIGEAIKAAQAEYVEADAALELAARRAERLGSIDPQKKKKRVGDFLLRRGYPLDMVIKIVKKI